LKLFDEAVAVEATLEVDGQHALVPAKRQVVSD